jgi:hypothetical protein
MLGSLKMKGGPEPIVTHGGMVTAAASGKTAQ